MENTYLTLHVGNDVIGSTSGVRNLNVTLDGKLPMKEHISKATTDQCMLFSPLTLGGEYCSTHSQFKDIHQSGHSFRLQL